MAEAKTSFAERLMNYLTVHVGGRSLIPHPNPPDETGFTSRRVQNTDQALDAVPAAYACVNRITETLSRLPRAVGRLTSHLEDDWEADEGHPVSVLLRQPSMDFDPWQFWQFIFRQQLLRGNGYAYIRRDNRGRPIELIPAYVQRINWQDGKVVRQINLWTGKWWRTGETLTVFDHQLICFHGPGFDGVYSPSPIVHAARRTLETMGFIFEHNRQQLEKGQYLRMVVKSENELAGLTASQREQLRKELEESYAGVQNSGKIPVFPPGFTPEAYSGMSTVDLALIDLLRWSLADICRIYNVPPRMIQQYQEGVRVTNSSMEAQAEDYVRWSIVPRAIQIQTQLTSKLLTPDERMMDYAVRMPVDRIRMGSWSEEVKAVDQAVAKGGLLTINEGRRRLGYPDREDGDRLISPKGAPAQNAKPDAPDMDGVDDLD